MSCRVRQLLAKRILGEAVIGHDDTTSVRKTWPKRRSIESLTSER